jgi:hypothetical protein
MPIHPQPVHVDANEARRRSMVSDAKLEIVSLARGDQTDTAAIHR